MKFCSVVVAAFIGTQRRKQGFEAEKCRPRAVPINQPYEIPPGDRSSPTKVVEFLTRGNHEVSLFHSEQTTPLTRGIREWLVPAAMAESASPPTQEEIKLLREAFATFYGVDRDLEKAEQLLTKAIDAWQRQPPAEKAGLYRVRGDCYMSLLQPQNAEKDYAKAIECLQGPGGEQADSSELPTSLLGRARAIRCQGKSVTPHQLEQAARDYQLSLRLSSRGEWDTDAENEEDGAGRNPYA